MIAVRPPVCPRIWEDRFAPSHGLASSTTFSGCQQRRSIRSDPFSPVFEKTPAQVAIGDILVFMRFLMLALQSRVKDAEALQKLFDK
jgi:hypothetical protein